MGLLIFTARSEEAELGNLFSGGGYDTVEFCHDLEDLNARLQIGQPKDAIPVKPYNLILIDISTSRDALRVCKELRESGPHYELPLIILSEDSSQEVFQMAFANGATDFLMKPVRGFELLTRTRAALKMKYEIERRKSREKELLEVTRQLGDVNTVLNRLSLIDSLTGIPNRRCFDQSLEQELKLSLRQSHPLSLIMLDIDYFKLFNDNYGHQEGDQCLKTIASCINRCLRRPSDLISRYGGEEFAAILPDTSEEGVLFITEKIRTTLAGEKIVHAHSKVDQFITVSQGVATFRPWMKLTGTKLIRAADKALYEAKQKGRNQVHVFNFPDQKQDEGQRKSS